MKGARLKDLTGTEMILLGGCLLVVFVILVFLFTRKPTTTEELSVTREPSQITIINQSDTLSCYTTSAHFDQNIAKVFTLLREMECTDAIINDNSNIILEIVTKPGDD